MIHQVSRETYILLRNIASSPSSDLVRAFLAILVAEAKNLATISGSLPLFLAGSRRSSPANVLPIFRASVSIRIVWI